MITAIQLPQAEEKVTFGKQVKTAGRAMWGLELMVKFSESIGDEANCEGKNLIAGIFIWLKTAQSGKHPLHYDTCFAGASTPPFCTNIFREIQIYSKNIKS